MNLADVTDDVDPEPGSTPIWLSSVWHLLKARFSRRIAGISALAIVVVLGGYLTWHGVRALSGWNQVERIGFDTELARSRLPATQTDVVPTPGEVDWDTEYKGILAIGSDERPQAQPNRQESEFADAVLLYLAPEHDAIPTLVSFPRDLLVTNPCTGEETKLDRTLEGCGDDISGPELVALAIEDFTGIGVDHFSLFGFEGFVQVIDALDGVELCLPHAVRENPALVIPAGCSVIDGETALWFVRSRTLQEEVNGVWRFVEDVSDIDRARRQQDLLLALLARLKTVQNPATLASVAQELEHLVVLSESLTISDGVGIAWELRSSSSPIERLIIPTESLVTEDGDFARRATVTFDELLSG